MKKIFVIIGLVMLLFLSVSNISAEEKKVKVVCIAFYNTENIFDTIHQEGVNDFEFLPNGKNSWDSGKYNSKIKNIAEVISKIGEPMVHCGPTIIGLSEIENKGVLQDLINNPYLKNCGYEIVHYDSPDRRGVDVGLLYKPSSFKVLNSVSVPYKRESEPGFKTRDQLVVTGLLDGDEISIIVNHWPSRGAGPEYRAGAASVTRYIVDSLLNIDPNAKIVVMGDLNDDPTDASVVKYLKAKGKEKQLQGNDLFNTTWKLYQDGVGTLAYRDSWNLFDQLIISQGLLNPINNGTYKYFKTKIFNEPFLIQKDGKYQGYPWRTFSAGAYSGGYSDHFPVYMYIVKEINK